MIISIDTEKAFDKTQYHLIIKDPKKFIIDRTYSNIIKATQDKPIANRILNGKIPKALSLK